MNKPPTLIFLLLLLSGCPQEPYCGDSICSTQENKDSCMVDCLEFGIVERVIDGDTIELGNNERARLIGIDTPERGEECYEEAKQRLQRLVEGKTVEMEKDLEDRDRYGRLLRYIYFENESINLKMVEEGYAYAFPYEPNTKYAEKFAEAESAASIGRGCLWQSLQ